MSEESNTITIHVTLPSGEQTKLIRVYENCTVRELKEAIRKETQIEVASQRLIYLGRILEEDSKRITEYDIHNNSGIQVSLVAKKEDSKKLFRYLADRKALVENITKYRGSISLNWLAWTAYLQELGARYPDQLDRFDYPNGSQLEIFRQGLLTFNTYVSVLELSPLFTPSLSSLQPSSTEHHAGFRCFYLGQWIDALDTVKKWLEATVIGISKEHVYIHYNGWPAVWDEWIHVNSGRLAPFRTHTRFIPLGSNVLPDVANWSDAAHPTGPEDSFTILENISQVTQSVWQKLSAFMKEYHMHRHQSDREEWEQKRKDLYKQYAPLLDRVGRLTTDAAMLLEYESENSVISQQGNDEPYTPVPTPAPITSSNENPTVGMNALVNARFNPALTFIPVGGSFMSTPLQVTEQLPPQQQQQQQQPIIVDIPVGVDIERSSIQSFFNDIWRRGSTEEPERPVEPDTRTTVLSESVAPQQTQPRESLLKRLQKHGLLTKEASVREDCFDHQHEVK